MLHMSDVNIIRDVKNHYQLQAGGFQHAFDEAIDAMLDKLQGWHEINSLPESLPDDRCHCWLTLKYRNNYVVIMSEYDADTEKFYNETYLRSQGYEFLAWQKIPQPYAYEGE